MKMRVGFTALAIALATATAAQASSDNIVVTTGYGPGQTTTTPTGGNVAQTIIGLTTPVCQPLSPNPFTTPPAPNRVCYVTPATFGSGATVDVVNVQGVVGLSTTESHRSADGDNYSVILKLGAAAH